MIHLSNLKGWLFSCLRNRILNEIRNQLLHQSHKEKILAVNPSSVPAENIHDLKVLEQQFNQALNQLSNKCREVFLLSREDQLSNKSIADKLQVSLKAVEKHITNALRIMRRELARKNEI